jgi:tetratricopeptide (TPR) repeat protein
MRSWLASVALVASTLLIPRATSAQPTIELDEERPYGRPDERPVTAGPMTEEAASAKQLFDAERWGEAALLLARVANGDSDDDGGNRQIAQFHLAIALYRLHFYHASYGIFAEIADEARHLKFNETLLWLAKLATQLPEPADVVERIGRYRTGSLTRFDNPQHRGMHWQISYLLGRYKYRNRDYEEAIRLFAKVDKGSKHYAGAQLWIGNAFVQLRKTGPAVKAFERTVQAIDEGAQGEPGLRDLALLSLARVHYAAGVRGDGSDARVTDPAMLRAAIAYWSRVEAGGERWLDALSEQSWAHFKAGAYSRALGNIHTIQAPYFPGALYPEADVLEALVSFELCHYEDATTMAANMQKRYGPIQRELERTFNRFFHREDSDTQFFMFLKDVRAGKTSLSAAARPVVERSFSDRLLLRHLDYVRVIDEEHARFKKAPEEFRSSPLGNDITDALTLAHDLAVRNAGGLARERYQATVDELSGHLQDARNLRDATKVERDRIAQGLADGQPTRNAKKEGLLIYAAAGTGEGDVLWPFDGEYWLDELGTYRQKVVSSCRKVSRNDEPRRAPRPLP